MRTSRQTSHETIPSFVMAWKSGDRVPLTKLEADISQLLGTDHHALVFECPLCPSGHWHSIPFHAGDPAEVEGVGQMWKKTDVDSTTPLENLTLEPSYNSACLHCYIRGGAVQIL